MGLVASQARYELLYGRKSDLEYKCQMICNRRQMLANQTTAMANEYINSLSNIQNGDIGSPYLADDDYATAVYQARTAILQAEDKKLEMELKNVETQQKAVSTEIDSVQKIIEKNIEKSFKTLG